MTNIKFETDKGIRENKRLNSMLKPDEKFCPCCGKIIKKTAETCKTEVNG